jgi:hypothetical protein
MIICDCCETELDEQKKAGWLSLDEATITILGDADKKSLNFNSLLFCSVDCLSKWFEQQIGVAKKAISTKVGMV